MRCSEQHELFTSPRFREAAIENTERLFSINAVADRLFELRSQFEVQCDQTFHAATLCRVDVG